jgi:hypothetical protein
MSLEESSMSMTPDQAVERCQIIFAHAWMVRTFVKHSEVVEDFPELMLIVRTVFDVCRALEPKVSEPLDYLGTLRKKISKLREAAAHFRQEAPLASDHTNFKQAVISMDGCVAELEGILKSFPAPPPPAMPPNFRLPAKSSSLEPGTEFPPAN